MTSVAPRPIPPAPPVMVIILSFSLYINTHLQIEELVFDLLWR